MVLRARDTLVSVRTELINTTRGLVKSMDTTAAVFESELRSKGKGRDSGRGRKLSLGAAGRDGE